MQVFKPHMMTDEILDEMRIILNSGLPMYEIFDFL